MLEIVQFVHSEEVEEFKPGEEKALPVGKYRFEASLLKDTNIVEGPFLEFSDRGVIEFKYTIFIGDSRRISDALMYNSCSRFFGGIRHMEVPYWSREMKDSFSLDHLKSILPEVRGQEDPSVKNRFLDVIYADKYPLCRIDSVHAGNINITLDERVELIDLRRQNGN